MVSPQAGWYRDPTGRHTMRYWDGSAWSDNASSGGQAVVDVVDDVTRFVPPAPGTEIPQAPTAYAPVNQDVSRSPGMSVAAIVMSALAAIAVIVLAVIVFTDDDDDTGDQDTAPTVVVDEPTDEPTEEATEEATEDTSEEETEEPTEAATTPAR